MAVIPPGEKWKQKLLFTTVRLDVSRSTVATKKQTKRNQKLSRAHLSYLLLLQVVSLDDDFALEGPAVAVVEDPLLGQQLGLLLSLRVLHVLLVLGQSLLLLLLWRAVVLAHLLRDTSRGASARSSIDRSIDRIDTEVYAGIGPMLVR